MMIDLSFHPVKKLLTDGLFKSVHLIVNPVINQIDSYLLRNTDPIHLIN